MTAKCENPSLLIDLLLKESIFTIEVCSGEIRSIRHPIWSKNGSFGLWMNGLRIIRMWSSDNIGLIGRYADDRIDQKIRSFYLFFFFFKKKTTFFFFKIGHGHGLGLRNLGLIGIGGKFGGFFFGVTNIPFFLFFRGRLLGPGFRLGSWK
jgi:hypothetical protein